MDEDGEQLSLEDVYDLASTIGKEFQMVIDTWGSDVVSSLMPKVICILQYLELSCVKKDSNEDELAGLKLQVGKLEQDKLEKAEHRLRYEMELEQIEEMWRKENSQLADTVKELKDENQRLSSIFKEKDAVIAALASGAESDLSAKDSVLQLKDEIRKKDAELEGVHKVLEEKATELDRAKDNISRLSRELQEARKRIAHVQFECQGLIEEKSELQVELEENKKEVAALNSKLRVAVEENIELSSLSTPERNESTPRFSLKDLRTIIIERNNLKSRLNEIEDELAVYKKPQEAEEARRFDGRSCEPTDEPPVQGPINREPLEKLFPERRPSKILKFFPSLSWNKLKT